MDEENISAHKPAKLLVIDDSEVSASADQKSAIEILKNHPIDVIFLNMFLGGENSYKFLERLKSNEDSRNIPVIMISSNDDSELLVKCIEAGAEDYLVKPLNQTILKARLSNCIAKKEAHDKEVSYLAKIKQGQKQIAAQKKMASVGVLVSSISQELKNPLNFVINFASVSAEICKELIQDLQKKELFETDEQKELLNQMKKFQSNVTKISDYGRNADQIIRFMLDQSNVDDNKKHPANINKIITQTITMLLGSYKSRGITNLPHIETTLDNNIPHIFLSIQSFSKVIYNILDNAIYAVTKKFEDLSQAQISIKVFNEVNIIRIVIRDNGIGIKPEHKSRIFEPFFTTKEGGMNPGLGLSTALEIIQNLKGSIAMDSSEGEFSEFKIEIPKQ